MAQRVAATDATRDRAVASLLGGGYPSSEEEETESEEEEEEEVDDGEIPCLGPCNGRHPPSNIVRCEVGHTFCFEDARAYVASQLGKGVPVLKCMHPSCDKIFPGTEVLKFIDLNIFKGVPKERLEIMIDRVGVRDLVEICPVCISVIICGPLKPGERGEIVCTNPTCGRKSCRKCKKLVHEPKTCEEAHRESLECEHCYKLYPPAEIVRCENGHPFCLDAARDLLNSQLGKGAPVLNCLHPGCDKIFPGKEVLKFIDLNIFKGVPKKTLEIMIGRVGLTGLVEICPNCTTVVNTGSIEENPILICTNPDCKKSYCRKCQKIPHGALTCEEAAAELGGGSTSTGGQAPDTSGPSTLTGGDGSSNDSSSSTGGLGPSTKPSTGPSTGGDPSSEDPSDIDAANPAPSTTEPNYRDAIRISIENEITAAVEREKTRRQFEDILTAAILRHCKNCQTPLRKKKGCNLMTCPVCRKSQCYVCGETITSEDHYSSGSCSGKKYDPGCGCDHDEEPETKPAPSEKPKPTPAPTEEKPPGPTPDELAQTPEDPIKFVEAPGYINAAPKPTPAPIDTSAKPTYNDDPPSPGGPGWA
ncbi:hypothetical protein BZA77DRAFT_20598 [Pyronema omphalodes]|nr:hypothetical protein BZA77DRAFT_20598 [Pyronema omphalodes]